MLPQTVVTLALETDEARPPSPPRATPIAGCCSCPASTGATPASGRSPASRTPATLPNGIVRGRSSAACTGPGSAPAWPVPGRALWVEADAVDEPSPSERAEELGRELRSVLTVLGERRRSRRLPELLRTATEPGCARRRVRLLARHAPERKVELLETVDVETRVEKALGVGA